MIPMGIRQPSSPAQEEIADAPPSGPVQEAVAQESPDGSASAEAAESPSSGQEETGEDLAASFDRQYQAVSKIDNELARYEIKRRRTPAYLELGRIATRLKAELGHGKWLPFLAEHGYAFSTGGLLMGGGIVATNGLNFSFANLSGTLPPCCKAVGKSPSAFPPRLCRSRERWPCCRSPVSLEWECGGGNAVV
jgi:hypothetical protein